MRGNFVRGGNRRAAIWFHWPILPLFRSLKGHGSSITSQLCVSRGKLLSSGTTPKSSPAKKTAAKAQSRDRDTGAALRSVYQKTIEETVPPDLLDLLGKLD